MDFQRVLVASEEEDRVCEAEETESCCEQQDHSR